MPGPTINKWGETWATPADAAQDAKPKFQIVPDTWRDNVYRRSYRQLKEITDPVGKELLKGNTVFVDIGKRLGSTNDNPYKGLYSQLMARGYRLQMHTYDYGDVYRGLLMWAEPLQTLNYCSRCGNFEIASEGTKPSTRGCESDMRYHSWRKIKKTRGHGVNKKRLREELVP